MTPKQAAENLRDLAQAIEKVSDADQLAEFFATFVEVAIAGSPQLRQQILKVAEKWRSVKP